MNLAALIRRMAAAGAPPEAIAIAVEAIEASEEARKRPARERKQRQRDAERDCRSEDTGQSQDGSVIVTGQGRDTPSTPAPSSPQTPHQPHPHTPEINTTRARGSRLPTNFELPDDWRDWAMAERGWTAKEAETEGAAFGDHWRAKPGKDAVKLDWPATWRNWVRNSRRNAQPGNRRREEANAYPLA